MTPFLLSSEQLEYLHGEERPRWHLDPPQREEYENDRDYTRALGEYANRCLKEVLLERLGKETYYEYMSRRIAGEQ